MPIGEWIKTAGIYGCSSMLYLVVQAFSPSLQDKNRLGWLKAWCLSQLNHILAYSAIGSEARSCTKMFFVQPRASLSQGRKENLLCRLSSFQTPFNACEDH